MDIRFYNTLKHGRELFEPQEPGKVCMYNCGPTVYDYAHIGNFRAFVFADLLRRFLELAGCEVHQVMNITDVGHMTEDQLADGGGEDKMQLAARRLKEAKKQGLARVDNPDDPYEVARFFTDAFLQDARALGLKIADEYNDRMPHATQHIPQMQAMISRLLDTGHAYIADDGAVYYSVQSFPDYGRLSGNTLDKLRGGAGGRVLQEHQSAKRHPADFLLWKSDPSHIMKWDSPWGSGYPGWHIECSAMAMHLLGREVIDIHTGGEDNIFPHHECEIAQACGATGKSHFARFWMHTRFLLVEGEKMSKSKGNFYTVRDVLDGKVTGRPVDPAVLRYELLKSHYRSNMNFTRKGLEDSASAVSRLRDVAARCKAQCGTGSDEVHQSVLDAFLGALADDLNISAALAAVFDFLGSADDQAPATYNTLHQIDRVLGVLATPGQDGGSEQQDDVAERCRRIDEARAAKDFEAADRLRQELIDAGYDVKTTRDGTTANRKLA